MGIAENGFHECRIVKMNAQIRFFQSRYLSVVYLHAYIAILAECTIFTHIVPWSEMGCAKMASMKAEPLNEYLQLHSL